MCKLKAYTGWFARIAVVVVSITLCAGNLWAQIESGRVTGTVTDQTGAFVNSARVTLTNKDTGVAATKITADGVYAFPAVQAGRYSVQVESAGFATHVTNDVEVHLQQTSTIDVQLRPGKVNEQVVVNSATPLLQTETAEIGQTISSALVDSMPLVGRKWSSLVQLAAGVTTPPPGYNNEGANGTPGTTYGSVNGTSLESNDYRLNGVGDMLEFYNGAPAIQPPPEAIDEFKLETGDYSAEIGHGLGGVLNAVMKSGTNKLHGDLFDYLRNDVLDARDWNTAKTPSIPKAELRQNLFGGTIGGPVYIPGVYNGRDKTFFFFDYQERKAIAPSPYQTSVPTESMVSSGFTDFQDLITGASGNLPVDGLGRLFPNGTIFDPATTRHLAAGAVDPVTGLVNNSGGALDIRDPFFNGQSVVGVTDYTTPTNRASLNFLPANRLDPNAVKLLSLYPAPNTGDYYHGNFFKNSKENDTDKQYDVRIDHHFSSKDMISGFYSWSNTDALVPPYLPKIIDELSGNSLNAHWSVNGSYTHLFGPTLTNEFRLGYGHQYRAITSTEGGTLGIPEQFGIQGIPQLPGNGGLPIIQIGGLATIGPGGWSPTYITAHNLQIIDNLTKSYGKHLLKIGVDANDIEGDLTQPPFGRGLFDFGGGYTNLPNIGGGSGIAQFLLTPTTSSVGGTDFVGGMDSLDATSFNGFQDHRWYVGTYFEDSFKITPTLTLDLGLRWDVFTPYSEINGRQANFLPNGANGPGGVYLMPQTTCGTAANPEFEQLLAQDGIKTVCSPGLNLGAYSKDNLAPRIGFAKRITNKYVIRAGFGIAYGSLDSIGGAPNLGQSYPYFYSVGYNALNAVTPLRFPDPFTGSFATLENGLSPVNATVVDPHGLTLYSRYPYNQDTPYTETYNLTNQYQITTNDSIQLAYVGSASRHLTDLASANAPSVMLAPGYSVINASGPNFIPFPDFGGVSLHATDGVGSYNSAQLTYEHRFSAGLTALGNYTFSRCLSDAGPQEIGNFDRARYLPGFGNRAEYTNCPESATHVVHISGSYKLPFGPKMHWQGNRVTNAVLGGWQVNGIYTYQSGNYFGLGCITPAVGDFGCYANLVGDPYAGARKLGVGPNDHWLNPAAFADPPPLTAADYDPVTGVLNNQQNFALLGNTRAFEFAGPSWYNIDASFFKEFHTTESSYFQFRMEGFNVLNNAQYSNPGNGNYLSPSTFMQVNSVRNGGRIVQLALKFYF